MKTKLLIAASVLIQNGGISQIIPTGGGQGTNSIEYWSRSGNNQNGSNNNIFGTKWNSPIYTVTGGIAAVNLRTKLNGVFISTSQYSINNYGWGQGVNTTGYMLLGISNNTMATGSPNMYNDKGAYSLLHINGPGSACQEFGYRPWMQTGITLTGNRDLSYIGLRQVGTDEDVTETTITWSDNNSGSSSPDDMVFRFVGEGNGNTTISTNLQSITDLDGLHIARFAPTGEFGLGNTFGINVTGTPAGLYVRPQSLMHLSLDGSRDIWSQYTNQTIGQTANDGLRFGLALTGGQTNGYLRWQEYTPFIIQTDWDNNAGGITSGERLRISSINAPGVPNPLGLNTNFTRISISHNGAQPVTQPRSLLHMGYNATNDGWRSWMDIGTYINNGSDHMYIGLKNEGGTDRYDAVINWGDNHASAGPASGPDNLRFIFTGTPGGSSPTNGVNGVEGIRMTPMETGGVYTGIGGDPSLNLYGPAGSSPVPTATLEVNSWGATSSPGGNSGLRFTNLQSSSPTIANPGNGVLSVNTNGDVIYVQSPTPGGGSLGNYCGATTNPLSGNYQIPMNNYNFYYTNNDVLGSNHIGIGYACNSTLEGKLSVSQSHPFTVMTPATETTAGYFINQDVSGVHSTRFAGVQGHAVGNNFADAGTNAGGYFVGNNASRTYGVVGISMGGGNISIGVYGEATGGGLGTYAGYFDGDVYSSGSYLPSDSLLKTNISTLSEVDSVLNLLRPVSFDYRTSEYPQLHLNTESQMGLIAQEVEDVFPNIVKQNYSPAVFDSLGNEIHPEVVFKTVDYSKLIPLLIAGHQEQGVEIDSLKLSNQTLQNSNDSLQIQVNDLNNRLSQLENCLSGILPFLCQLSQNAIQSNSPGIQEAIRSELSVYLDNREAIILDQNVPNPFAEQTVINFSIPESVKRAQIHFYNSVGQLIQTFEIRERGMGNLTVFGADLSSGTYIYTLVADGVNVATKKMVKE